MLRGGVKQKAGVWWGVKAVWCKGHKVHQVTYLDDTGSDNGSELLLQVAKRVNQPSARSAQPWEGTVRHEEEEKTDDCPRAHQSPHSHRVRRPLPRPLLDQCSAPLGQQKATRSKGPPRPPVTHS